MAMNQENQSINLRKQRWLDFYDPNKSVHRVFIIYYTPDLGARPWPRPDLKAERIEWAWKKYQIQMDQLAWLDDDSIPYLDIYTGTEIFAQAFGCKVVYPDNDMPFARPLINSAKEVSSLQIPDIGSTNLALLFEIADALRERAGSDALLKLVDVQSPMDIAALIWEKTSFYTALRDSPNAVLELSNKVMQFLIQFLDEWFGHYGREFIAHFPDYYMPMGITLSEDEVGSVSPAMFMKFYYQELFELSEHFGGIGIHCCANARHQWKNFLKIPNLRMINLIQPLEIIQESWPFFAEQTAQTYDCSGDDAGLKLPEPFPEESRMAIYVTVDSKSKAMEVSSMLRERGKYAHQL